MAVGSEASDSSSTEFSSSTATSDLSFTNLPSTFLPFAGRDDSSQASFSVESLEEKEIEDLEGLVLLEKCLISEKLFATAISSPCLTPQQLERLQIAANFLGIDWLLDLSVSQAMGRRICAVNL